MRPYVAPTLAMVLAIVPLVAPAQTQPVRNPPHARPEGGFNGLSETTGNQSTLRALLLGAAVTSWARRYDDKAVRFFSPEGSWESKERWWKSELIDVGDAYGFGAHLAGLSAAAWGLGLASGDSALRKTGQTMGAGLLLDAAIVTSVKLATGRRRPDGADSRSFPSGHTSGAFTISTILSRRHGWRIGIPAYALAALTAVGRMEDSRHYASDVVAGAFLGVLVGQFVTPSSGAESKRVQIISTPVGTGLQVSF